MNPEKLIELKQSLTRALAAKSLLDYEEQIIHFPVFIEDIVNLNLAMMRNTYDITVEDVLALNMAEAEKARKAHEAMGKYNS